MSSKTSGRGGGGGGHGDDGARKKKKKKKSSKSQSDECKKCATLLPLMYRMRAKLEEIQPEWAQYKVSSSWKGPRIVFSALLPIRLVLQVKNANRGGQYPSSCCVAVFQTFKIGLYTRVKSQRPPACSHRSHLWCTTQPRLSIASEVLRLKIALVTVLSDVRRLLCSWTFLAVAAPWAFARRPRGPHATVIASGAPTPLYLSRARAPTGYQMITREQPNFRACDSERPSEINFCRRLRCQTSRFIHFKRTHEQVARPHSVSKTRWRARMWLTNTASVGLGLCST